MALALLWICAGTAACVFVAMLYSVATFNPVSERRSTRKVAIEVVWSLVPIVIFAIAAAPTFRSLGGGAAN